MAYKMPPNPDALPRFAEPERENLAPRPQPPPTQQYQRPQPPQPYPKPQPPPPLQQYHNHNPPPGPQPHSLRHANTYDQRTMSGAMGSDQPPPPPPQQPYSSGYQTLNFPGPNGPPRTSPRLVSGHSPHLSPMGPPPGSSGPSPRLPPGSSGPSPRLPPSPSRDPDTTQALLPLFRAVDRDGRNQLSERELGSALVNGDFTSFDPHTVRMMIRMFDSDRSGTIGFDEFCGLWSFLSQWRSLFDRFDSDHSGNINLPEFRDALFAFRYRLSDRFTDMLFRQFDKRGENHLSFDLFVQASITLKRMTDTFKKYDDDRDGFITLAFEDFLEEILKQMR